MSVNGTAGIGILRLGDRVPQTEPIEITRDGRPVMLTGYFAGPRCPLSVTSLVDAVNNQYWDGVRIVDKDGNPVLDDQGRPTYRRDDLLWMLRIRGILSAVVQGLTFDEADVIVGSDYEMAINILSHFGWFTRKTEDTADPEATGEAAPASPSTTAPSSHGSTSTTAPETGVSSPKPSLSPE